MLSHTLPNTAHAAHAHSKRCCCTISTRQPARPCKAAALQEAATQLVPQLTDLSDAHTAAVSSLAVLASQADALQPGAAAGISPSSSYTPGPVEVGWQIWFAAVVSTIPFVIGAWEFGKRIVIQRRCKVCGGNGLVQRGRYQRKCPECGGFFPWISWRMFLSANARPGNGGPLLQPRGQTSVLYTVPPADSQQQQQQQQPNHTPTESADEPAAAVTEKQPTETPQPAAAALQEKQRQES